MTPIELRDRLAADQPLGLIDVREPHEKEIADLPDHGQRTIPVNELMDRMDELDPEEVLVVYCRTGARSRWAVGQLRRNGFEKVYNLEGGVMGWRNDVDPSLREY